MTQSPAAISEPSDFVANSRFGEEVRRESISGGAYMNHDHLVPISLHHVGIRTEELL